jgi:hypothetical protein
LRGSRGGRDYRCPDDPDECPQSNSPGYCTRHPMSLLETVRLPVTAPLAPEPAEPPVPSTCDEVTLELLGRSVSVPTDGLRRHTNHTVLVEGLRSRSALLALVVWCPVMSDEP